MKRAFTLAEVLITLGIIGVIVAITLPTVVSKFERKKNATVLRKAYSDLGNYVQMFSVENGCISQLSECPERGNDFARSFASYLIQRHKFKDMHPCNISQNWLMSYFKNSRGEVLRTAYYGCTTIPTTYANLYLVAPSGAYAYFFQLFPGDMFYKTKDNKDFFRLKVIILTDQSKMGYITRWGESTDGSTKKYPQEGRNMFTAFIMDSKAILPQGSSKCTTSGSWSYYCVPLTDSNCSYDAGNFENCMQQIIDDGWEIKYKY